MLLLILCMWGLLNSAHGLVTPEELGRCEPLEVWANYWSSTEVHACWGMSPVQVTSPKKKKKRVTQVFKNIPNHSLCDLHTILNEHTSIISIQEPSKRKQNIFVYFCLFLSVDFVNILPKSGGEQTLIELDPPCSQWAGRGGHHILGVSGCFYGLIMCSSR